MKRAALAPAARVLAALLLAALAQAAAPAARPAPDHLPPLATTALDGTPFAINPAARDVVVVHFWATWCAPCRADMPILDAAFARHAHQRLRMVGISLDSAASRGRILAGGMDVHFALVRAADIHWHPRDLPTALPETRIYGRDGAVLARFGPLDAARFEQALVGALAQG